MYFKIAAFLILIHYTPPIILKSKSNDDISINSERVVLAFYNSNIVTEDVECVYRKINRTTFGLSAHFDLLRDIMDEDVMLHLKLDRKVGADYHYTGLELKLNLCTVFKKNTFGIPRDLEIYGNLKVCNVSKGLYYIKDYPPNLHLITKYLLPGNMKLYIGIYHHDVELFTLHWYLNVEKKVAGW